MRHRWRHLPSRIRPWASSFSSALSLAACAGCMSAGSFTVIFTWNSMGISSGSGAAEERQALFIQGQAEAGGAWHLQGKVAVQRRFADDVLGQQQRTEQLGAPSQLAQGDEGMGRSQGAYRAFEHGAAVQSDTRRFGNCRSTQHGSRATVLGNFL